MVGVNQGAGFGTTNNRVKRDKGSKLLSSLLYAKQFAAEYVFIADADDWVNKGVAAYLEAKPRHPVDFLEFTRHFLV